MDKQEFNHIALTVIENIADEFRVDGASTQILMAATLTMQLFLSRLTDEIFEDDNKIEIER